MGKPLAHNEVTKIEVVGDDRALLGTGDLKQIAVERSLRIIGNDRCNVMTKFDKKIGETGVCILIQQKPHTADSSMWPPVRLGGAGMTSEPSTSACA